MLMKKKLFFLKIALVAIATFAVQATLRAAEQVTSTYTFTSKSWTATLNDDAANWTSGKDGAGFSNNGVQVTTSYSGANATSPEEFDNITKIVVTYNTNKTAGKGTLDVKIGDNEATSMDWAYSNTVDDGRIANFTAEFEYATPQSGAVTLTANTTVNSIYVVSVAITHDQSAATTVEKPAFSLEPGSYVGTQSVEISCATEGAAIYYTTDGTTPTAESTAYTGAVSVTETATIKAIAINGEDKSQVASAAYTILESIANTEATAFTVSDVVALIDSKDAAVLAHPENQVYVKGIVSKVQSYNSTYKSITYWISEDGTEESQQFEVYGGFGIDGAEFASIDDVQVGYSVIVKGNAKKFTSSGNTTYEVDKNNIQVKYVGPLEDIVVVPEEGADIYAAVQTASEGKNVKDIYVYLAPGKNFTISAPIVARAAFVVMGAAEGTDPSTIDETATPAVVDASALTGPFVQMSTDPAVDADANGFYPLADVGFLNVKVTGLAQQLFYANKVKYLMNCFHLDFCNINVAGGNKTVIDTNGGGVIATLDMSKNTIWAEPANTGALYSSQSGQKATEAGLAVQTFNIERNTFYNIAYTKNTCSHRQANQTWLTYNVKNNVFVNTGKSGQAIKGLNGGASGSNPTWDISGNSFNFDGADTSAAESTGDEAEPVTNSLAGVFAFDDAANGDFNGVFKGEAADAPAKYPGDPRWTYAYKVAPIDVVLEPEDIVNEDITAAIAAKANGRPINNLTINLSNGVTYSVSATMTAGGDITINGNGAFIYAGGCADNFITLDGTEQFAKKADDTDSDHKLIDKVAINTVTILNLTNALVKDAQKTLVNTLSIVDSNIEMPAGAKNVIDFNGKGYVGKVEVVSSTIWAEGMNTGYFAQYGSRPKNINGDWLQEFNVESSTFVNIANDKNFCNFNQKGTAQNVYTILNSLFVDCGKQNQVVVGFNAGQTSATPEWNVYGNAFNWGGEDVSAAETTKAGQKNEVDIVQNSVAGVIAFDSGAGNFSGTFTLAEGATEPTSLGDPRWKITYEQEVPTAIDAIKAADADDNAPMYNLAGQKVSNSYKGVVIKNGRKVVMK